MKKCLFIILLLACVNALNAANFSEKSTLSLGAYGNFGAAMGGAWSLDLPYTARIWCRCETLFQWKCVL